MTKWIGDFRVNCLNLLSLTECGNFDNVDADDLKKIIYNPHVQKKMSLSGIHYIHIPPNELREPTSWNIMDSYHGTFSFYDWHKDSIEYGAGFSPINYLLDEIVVKFPNEKNIINTIFRKSTYLNTLQAEMKYISERYVWAESEKYKEVFLAKFENFATSLVELIVTCINLYERTALGKTDDTLGNFKKILPFLADPQNKLPSMYQWGINYSIDLSFYIYIRNSLVHNLSEIKYIDNGQNPILKIDNVPSSNRYGLFNEYITMVFKEYNGKKICCSFNKCYDHRFPYISIDLWLTKSATLETEKSKIGFEMGVLDLTKEMLGELFILQRDLFTIIRNS